MTREDFKLKGKGDVNVAFYNKAIDVAFNYFESRTCESCKHYTTSHEIFANACHLLSMSSQGQPIPDNFSCNKWEAQDV